MFAQMEYGTITEFVKTMTTNVPNVPILQMIVHGLIVKEMELEMNVNVQMFAMITKPETTQNVDAQVQNVILMLAHYVPKLEL